MPLVVWKARRLAYDASSRNPQQAVFYNLAVRFYFICKDLAIRSG
jgi:hypothetical protein